MRISSVAGGLKQLWPGDFVYMLDDARVSLRKYRLVCCGLRPSTMGFRKAQELLLGEPGGG